MMELTVIKSGPEQIPEPVLGGESSGENPGVSRSATMLYTALLSLAALPVLGILGLAFSQFLSTH